MHELGAGMSHTANRRSRGRGNFCTLWGALDRDEPSASHSFMMERCIATTVPPWKWKAERLSRDQAMASCRPALPSVVKSWWLHGKLDLDFHGTSYWTCGASSHSDRLVFTPTTVGNTRSVKPCRLVSVCACAIPCPCLGSSLPSDLHRHRLHPHPTTSVQALTAEFRMPFQACPSNPELMSRREDEKKRSQVHRQSGRLWKRPCT